MDKFKILDEWYNSKNSALFELEYWGNVIYSLKQGKNFQWHLKIWLKI
jgi:hypothetical protein